MSAPDAQGGAGRREVAWRVFAAEYDDASLEYSEDDDERAPNYVVTPSGARINRVFVVGVLTEVESVSDGVLRARIVDPTGAFVSYAGQYQPDARAFLERAEPPAFVAVTGKARTYQPDDSDRVFTSVRPESINEVDAETRDRWIVQTAAHTLGRVATLAPALDRPERGDDLQRALLDAGVDYGLASGIPLAIEHYGTTTAYLAALRDVAIEAVEVVAGDRDEVAPFDAMPDEGGDVALDLGDATGPAILATAEPGAESEPEGVADDLGDFDDFGADAEPTDAVDDEPAVGTDAEPTVGVEGGTPADTDEESTVEGEDGTTVDTDELYELDDDERAEIEEEYGTEFATGTEVDEPGAADIETSAPEGAAEPTAVDGDEPVDPETSDDAEAAAEPGAPTDEPVDAAGASDGPDEGEGTDAEAGEKAEPEAGSETEIETASEAGDVDLEDAVVEEMRERDEGDGADREAVIEAVASASGADPADVEDAVQDALMSGKCYEPADGRLKAI